MLWKKSYRAKTLHPAYWTPALKVRNMLYIAGICVGLSLNLLWHISPSCVASASYSIYCKKKKTKKNRNHILQQKWFSFTRKKNRKTSALLWNTTICAKCTSHLHNTIIRLILLCQSESVCVFLRGHCASFQGFVQLKAKKGELLSIHDYFQIAQQLAAPHNRNYTGGWVLCVLTECYCNCCLLQRKACVCLLGQEEVQPLEAITFPPGEHQA